MLRFFLSQDNEQLRKKYFSLKADYETLVSDSKALVGSILEILYT